MDSKFLPFLTLWTIVVIFLLYKSLSLPTFDNPQDVREFSSIAERQSQEVPENSVLHQNQLLIQQTSTKLSPEDQQQSNSPVITKNPIYQSQSLLTTKKSTNEYVRQSKVFILIIQNEDLRISRNNAASNTKRIKNRDYKPTLSSSSSSTPPSTLNNNRFQRLTVSAHIRLLISILDAHRIEYVIDSTRGGLPTLLLADQDNVSENKLYSVIIIDDFIKYTKLNRWLRDQLDRHCRTNQIGVIAYLTNRELERQKVDNHRGQRKANVPSTSSSTEESLAEQFPLTFKPISQDQHSCTRKISNSSSSCLFDYQLNELSPILRILKRRPNFIIDGPLANNINRSPWVSMSSNHITYEPLTWAKVIQSEEGTNHYSSHEQNQNNSLINGPVNTHNRDQNLPPSMRELSNYTYVIQPGEYSVQESELQIMSVDQQQQYRQRKQLSTRSGGTNSSGLYMHDSSSLSSDPPSELVVLSMYDNGLYDGIKRVLFGGASHIWLNRVLILDSIEHLSAGRIISPLERYMQIDIDDIFVGERGKRMNKSDVDALVEMQRRFASRIEGGFKFNLGYSGKYFKHGSESENEGDEQLILKAREFTWFCHTWSHSKAHLHNETEIIALELRKNIDFALSHSLPIVGGLQIRGSSVSLPTYAVAPHHSGVYPIHEQLYDAWREVLNVQVTSTEEYPALRPASGRRAFVHKAIKVLPRQTCGLYTHTVYRDKYPGGFAKLEANIKGGELFESVLHNPVNIYMTHMSNYANDRLALYTFSNLLDFVQSNTNLQLTYAPTSKNQLGPAKLADYYFALHPHESEPVWTNPCNDRRHLAIWSAQKYHYCNVAPKLLIVGPQKTGTTALYTFLKLNPLFKSSQPSMAADFEEVQFFNDKHYREGIDWYFQRFSTGTPKKKKKKPKLVFSSSDLNKVNDIDFEVSDVSVDTGNFFYNYTEQETIYFEKSATYFDDPKVPERARSLLPDAKIVILLVDPGDRAYSWYQHMKAHGDVSAKTFNFEQVIMANEEQLIQNPSLRVLRNRCLHPGYYSQHLSKWLDNYPSRQIIIIDGLWFKQNPASVMNRLQLILRINQPLDYNQLLIYNSDKGFFCSRILNFAAQSDKSRCLGSSKGRKYEPMSLDARAYLNHHYLVHNRQLARILSDIGQPLPAWLDEAVSIVSSITLF